MTLRMLDAIEEAQELLDAGSCHSKGRAEALARLSEALHAVVEMCPALPVVAIRWMRLKHPLHEVQEALLRKPDGGNGTHLGRRMRWNRLALQGVWRLARCAMYAAYLSVHLARLRLLLWRQIGALRRQEFHVVARTVCFESSPARDRGDFYFGSLQERLAARGVRMLLLCGDGTGGRWLTFAKGHVATSGLCRLPELALVHPLAPIQMAGRQIRSFFSLLTNGRRLSDPFIREVNRLASLECLSQETALTGLLCWVGQAAVRIWHPQAFMTLHEGHAWELCLRLGVKTQDPSCRTVGYQHTMVFRESVALTAPSDTARAWTVPDLVLCLGRTPLELMRAGHERFRARMLRFGSFRYRAPRTHTLADRRRRTILVTPEGIPSEVGILFDFVSRCARRLPSYAFLLRCHPQVPMAQALKLSPAGLADQPNVMLSEEASIEDDFARASVLLYRGSSSVMYGILHGLLPVYLRAGGSDRDPLYALQAWRHRCATPEELAVLLEQYEHAAQDAVEAEWTSALRYVNDYTGPVDDGAVDALLTSLGLKGSSA